MTTMNLMNTVSVNLISIASKAVIETAYYDGAGISFDDKGVANYRLIEQSRKNFFEAWMKEFEIEEEAVYQEDRFGVPVEVLRYETKSFVQNTNVTSTVYAVDSSVPF